MMRMLKMRYGVAYKGDPGAFAAFRSQADAERFIAMLRADYEAPEYDIEKLED